MESRRPGFLASMQGAVIAARAFLALAGRDHSADPPILA
jgi:hypothetical protein